MIKPVFEKVSELLEQRNGVLFWVSNYHSNKVGKVAGCKDRYGYLRVGINGQSFRAHQIVWLLSQGAWPTKEIDHINGKKDDNRISNLRLCTASQNSANRRPISAGLKGITIHKKSKKFQSQITVLGKCIYLGLFEDATEAAKAYDKAAMQYFGDFAYLNFERTQ